jgi:ornithine cyclodeaminase
MREVDDEVVLRATIVVDTFEGCLSEAGDLLIPMGEGKLKKEGILGDLGDLVTDRHRAYEKAIREGRGKRIEMS